MNRVKFFGFFKMVPKPLEILNRFLFMEPFIEKFSTFELKTYLIAYSICISVFFDKRANKNMKKFVIGFHIAATLFQWVFCGFYLTDLSVHNIDTITLGVLPIILTTAKMSLLLFSFCFYDEYEQLTKFFIADENRPNAASSAPNHGRKEVKKWVILVVCIFVSFYLGANLFFDPEKDTKMNGLTSRPHLVKFFPVWCPFENMWARSVVSIFQDIIVVPELFLFCCGTITMFILIVEMQNKFAALLAELKLFSECTFERIEILDRQLEEAMHIASKRTRACITRGLNEERTRTMTIFYHNFVYCVERFQQLQRFQLVLKKCLDCCCSIEYCLLLSIMIGFGFVGTEALSNFLLEIDFIVKMAIWFLVCGCMWFMICAVGELFSSQNDSFGDEVYSMPWYYLTPKQRKTVFTFLTIVQKPMYLRALKLLDVNKETFPDFLNSVYSYVQIMQTLQQVKRRHV